MFDAEDNSTAWELVQAVSTPNETYTTHHLLLALLVNRLERLEMTVVHEVVPLLQRIAGA